MAGYRVKSNADLRWADNRDAAMSRLRRLYRRLENQVLGALDQQFKQALTEGREADFEVDDAMLVNAIRQHVLALPSGAKKGARVSGK